MTMDILRSLPLAGAIAAGVYILHRTFRELFGGPGRRESYRRMEEELDRKRPTGRNTPKCPLCGGYTEKVEYRFTKVWRCLRYPECRGFVRAKRGKPRFLQHRI